MERRSDESYISFVDRVSQSLADGLITYEEWSENVLDEVLYSEENLRRCYQFFSKFLDKLDKEEVKELNGDKRVQEIQKAQSDLIKERKRLQTVNSELQETYRYLGRNELLNERIVEAINNLSPIEVKRFKTSYPSVATGLCLISDLHYGSNYEVKGLFGEVVNKYSEEICRNRLWELISKIEADCMEYDDILVGCLGDVIENILRPTSLAKLRKPVVDTVIEVSELLSQWLVELHNRTGKPIKFCMVGGNHDIQRLLGEKPQFDEENYAKLILKYIELRIGEQEQIKIEPYSDACFQTLYNNNILLVHGTNDLASIVDYYEDSSNVSIDCVYAGHLHNPDSKTLSIGGNLGDKEAIRVGSICGSDTFSKKMLKSARPSAYFAIYNEDGKGWTRNYYL